MPRLDRLLLRVFEPCTVFFAPTDVAGQRNVLLEIFAHVLGGHWSLLANTCLGFLIVTMCRMVT